jgi:hypothetical protein
VWVLCTVDYRDAEYRTGDKRTVTTYYFKGAAYGDNIEHVARCGAAMVDGLVDDVDGPPTATSRVHV